MFLGCNLYWTRTREQACLSGIELMRKLQDAECEATEEAKSSRRCGTKRRTRAAEVHNLSERVRSDYTSQSFFKKESLLVYCSYSIVD
jgi:hypothetical protein